MIAKISPDGMGAIRAEIHVIYAQLARQQNTEMCRSWVAESGAYFSTDCATVACLSRSVRAAAAASPFS